MTKRMLILLVGALAIFGGLFAMKGVVNQKMNEYLDAMPVPAATISAAEAGSDSWVQEVTSVGTVSAIRGAELTTQVSGIVEKIYFGSGTEVKAGDVILRLDSATDLAELKTLQAAEKLSEIERDRVQRLWKSKSISKAEYDLRQSELEQARARTAAQRARMAQKELTAPFAGHLGIRRVNTGQYVHAGDPLIGLQSLESVFVDFTLPEQRFSDVRVGMLVRAEMDALADTVFEGKISAIEPVIDADTRNFKVQATFENPDELLRPGMFARISLNVGEQRQVIIVPRTAISFKPYGNSVYILTETDQTDATGQPLFHVKQRLITTGEARGDLMSIEKGLEVGERVATSGLLKLRSGGTAVINNTVEPSAELTPTPDNG